MQTADRILNRIYRNADNRRYFYEGLGDTHPLPETITEQKPIEFKINTTESVNYCPNCFSTNISWRDNWVRCTCCGEVLLHKKRLNEPVLKKEEKSVEDILAVYDDVSWNEDETLLAIDLSDIVVPELSKNRFIKIKYRFNTFLAI